MINYGMNFKDIFSRFRGPKFHNNDILVIKLRVEFEPFGKASEDWDLVWTAELPRTQGYWKNIRNERIEMAKGLKQRFRSKTLHGLLNDIKEFMNFYNKK